MVLTEWKASKLHGDAGVKELERVSGTAEASFQWILDRIRADNGSRTQAG